MSWLLWNGKSVEEGQRGGRVALQNASGGNAPVCHLPSGIKNSLLLCLAVAVSAVCGFIFTHGKRGNSREPQLSVYILSGREERHTKRALIKARAMLGNWQFVG